jgi:hypothetical protein
MGATSGLGRAALVAVAGRGRPPGHRTAATAVGVLRDREKKECSRVFKGNRLHRSFIPPKVADGRRITPVQIERLWTAAASGGCWVSFRPKRGARAGRFGGPPVGCWAAGPGGGWKSRSWANFDCGLEKGAVNSDFCHFVLIFFISNYLCFRMYLLSIQI